MAEQCVPSPVRTLLEQEVTMQGLASGLLLVGVFAAVTALAVLLGLRLLRATRGAAGEPLDA
jgi:hypothetical protein